MEDLTDVDSKDELVETRTHTQINVELLVTNNLGYPENRDPFYSHTRNIPEVIDYKTLIKDYRLIEARQEWNALGQR